MLAASPRYLDKAKHKSLNLIPAAARDAFGISGDPRVRQCSMPQFREPAHVQFNFALIYSASRIDMGRSFSGVTS
jgi:hypothetical protein